MKLKPIIMKQYIEQNKEVDIGPVLIILNHDIPYVQHEQFGQVVVGHAIGIPACLM
jgi:hypothetical protein